MPSTKEERKHRETRTREVADPRPGQAWAEELAWRLSSSEGLRLARLLQATGAFAPPVSEPPAHQPTPEDGPRPIRIWQPREVDGELVFERPEPSPLGDHYAAARTLSARKRAHQRVCLLGESTAAGYLYSPHLTPAELLERYLTEVAGNDAFEVVDLARTNERLLSLAETAEAALQLDPDVFVVFVGNNWSLLETPETTPYAPSVTARQRYAGELLSGGILGPPRRARLDLVGRVRVTLDRLADLAGDRPVVLLIPEVNLGDWESLQPPPWLPGHGTSRWHQLYVQALSRLQNRDFQAVEKVAWEMVDLDGGSNPTPFRLLAHALAARGRDADARDAAISEVDAVHYPLLAFLGAPQATSTARELLSRGADEHGFTAVDLRRVFAGATGQALPGRRLFLDYCHLTPEGMKLAMVAATAAVLNVTGEVGGDGLLDLAGALPDPQISQEQEAVARFGAALHTAHRLVAVTSKRPILEHWIESALNTSPGIIRAMLELVSVRGAPIPAALSVAWRRNLESDYPLSLQHGWAWPGLDVNVIEAITAVLDRTGVEWDHQPASLEVERRLLEHLEPPAAGVDLARGERFLAEPLHRFFPEALAVADLPERATLRAPWSESGFCLVTAGDRNFELRLVARLPPIPGWSRERRGSVTVALNGMRVGEVSLSERWRREVLRVGRRRLRRGINRVTLTWPPLPPAGTEALTEARRRLETGIVADLHPVFGEVFSLVVRPLG